MSESPYYTQSSPLKNQGVFSGDGNQYRFSFSVYTGENIPGGVEEDTDLYYCFQFGDYYSQPVDFPGALDRCWIKKTAIESISGSFYSAYNIVVVKYQTGSVVLFYKGEPVGVIHNGPLSPEILWGVSITFSFPNYVYKDSDVASLKTLLDTANSLGKTSFDKLSVIFKANLLLDEDRLEYISKQEQIAYNDVRFVSSDYALHPILDESNSLDKLYIALPINFRLEDYRIRTENEDDDDLEKPELSDDKNWIGGGLVNLSPENVSALTFPDGFSGQYSSLTIDPITDEITSVGDVITTFGFMTEGYSTNILPLLQQDGDQVVLYMVLSLDENKDYQTSLAHVDGQNPTVPEPEDGSVHQVLCTVRRSGFSFLLFTNSAYNRTVTSGVITLKRPPKLEIDDLSIERNSSGEVQIAGWETQAVAASVDMTQTEFVARSEGGGLVFVDLSELMLEPDAVSINKNTDDKLEIKGWSGEASIDTPEDMTNLGFVCRDGTPETNILKFVKLDDLKTETEVDDITIEKDTENDDALQIKGFPSEDAVLLDINDEGVQDGNENETEWAFLTRVTDGDTPSYLQYTKHIAARYFLKGDEDNSLGVVRGVTAAEDETDDNPLAVRLAGVDETPGETNQQRVYAYGTDGKWGLYELEMLFQLDAINKRFYYNPQKYDTGTQRVLDHSAPTAKFDFEWDSNTYNSVKVRVITDVRWDSTLNKLIKSYRDITLPKILVSHVSAETDIDVVQGQECE